MLPLSVVSLAQADTEGALLFDEAVLEQVDAAHLPHRSRKTTGRPRQSIQERKNRRLTSGTKESSQNREELDRQNLWMRGPGSIETSLRI
jgi:hypothetical protein